MNSLTDTEAESPLERWARRATTPSGVALAVLAALWAWVVVSAPVDATQGVIQKVLYIHVPVVLGAYLGFGCTALCGALYLWRRDPDYDRLAAAAAEVGVVFCVLVFTTGPIWARGTWGKWWSWDLRLTVTLLLFLTYLAYLLLRSFTEGSERTARFAAVYGIVGVALIPLNYFAIDLAGGRAIHPENLGRGSLGAGMGLPFALGMALAALAFFHLWLRRFGLARLRAREEREALAAEEALGAAWDT